MPTIGNTTPSASATRSLAGNVRGLLMTMTEDGVLESITARVSGSSTRVVALLYSAAGSLLDQSAVRSDVSTLGDYAFTGFTYALQNATNYYFCVCADSGTTCDVAHYSDGTYSINGYGDLAGSYDADSPPASTTMAIDGGGRDWNLYATYTTGGPAPIAAYARGSNIILRGY